jgi:hypothetical protein
MKRVLSSISVVDFVGPSPPTFVVIFVVNFVEVSVPVFVVYVVESGIDKV